MSKSFINVPSRLRRPLALHRLETGFSMLEAVVVVGVLLALAVGGFFAYGPITENAKMAKVKSAASETLTAATVASFDGYSETQPQDVIDSWNASTDQIRVEILEPEAGSTTSNGDFCVQATNVSNPEITTRTGSCSNVTESGGMTPDEMTNPIPAPNGTMTTVWDTRGYEPWGEYGQCSTITVPLVGTVDATINWGDGYIEEFTTGQIPTHTYIDTPGLHTVTIDGMFTGWVGAAYDDWSMHCLTEVTEWGETGTTDVENGFRYAVALSEVSNIPTTATNWTDLFYSAESFNGDISGWSTSHVTNMYGMFSGALSFNQNISGWDTSHVTDMGWMLAGASAFNQDLSGWNTSQVKNMSNMLPDVLTWDITGWDTSRVEDMSGLFRYQVDFNQDISGWNTSQVKDMTVMFGDAASFSRDISGWDTSKVVNMDSMFQGASSFNQDINRWNTSSVTNMRAMFGDSPLFNKPLDRWDVSKVTNMSYMFSGASTFNQNLSGWTPNSVTNADSFRNGSALTDANLPPGAMFR